MVKSFALAAAFAALAPLAQATIDSPSAASIVACQPVKFTWYGGQPPYFLSFVAHNLLEGDQGGILE
jgi:hypothetical protein